MDTTNRTNTHLYMHGYGMYTYVLHMHVDRCTYMCMYIFLHTRTHVYLVIYRKIKVNSKQIDGPTDG